MKGGDATNGTLNVARPGRPGDAGLVEKAVLAAGSSEPTIRMCRSNGMKDVGAGHTKTSCSFFWSGVSVYDHEKYALRQGEMCIFPPGELCCEKFFQCEDAADSGSLMILFPCVTHAVGISFSRLPKIKIVKKPETGAVLSICTFKDGRVEGIHLDKVGQPCEQTKMSPSCHWRTSGHHKQPRLHQSTKGCLICRLAPVTPLRHSRNLQPTFAAQPASSNSVTDIDFHLFFMTSSTHHFSKKDGTFPSYRLSTT